MKLREAFIPRLTRPGSHGIIGFWWLGLATLYEGLVITLSLGFLNVDTRAWMLIEVLTDDD